VDAGWIFDTHVRFSDDLSNICTEVVGGALNVQGNMTDRSMFSSNCHGWKALLNIESSQKYTTKVLCLPAMMIAAKHASVRQIAFAYSDHSAMSVT